MPGEANVNPDQRERFERQAILEAHATLLVRLAQGGADADHVRHQLSILCESVEALLVLPDAVQKAA